MSTFSERLRATNAAGWDAAVGHRFVDELLAGTLADDVLAGYLVQDYQFCDAFTALLGQGCASAPDLDSRLVFARQLGMFASDENTYFVDSFDALGVPEQQRSTTQLSDATAAFDALMREPLDGGTDHFDASNLEVTTVDVGNPTAAFDALMREALHSRSYAQVLAVLLVAEWLYLDWATRPDAGDSGRPEHLGWIDLHRGPAFTTWVDWLRAQLDAHEPTDDGERRVVESVFARAVRCELTFFDAAYHD